MFNHSSKKYSVNVIYDIDKENRIITVLEGNGWKFQFDEQLPFEMIDGIDIVIPKGVIHRVIKGSQGISDPGQCGFSRL